MKKLKNVKLKKDKDWLRLVSKISENLFYFFFVIVNKRAAVWPGMSPK